MSNAAIVTLGVVGVFVICAVVVIIRLLLRREGSPYRRWRVGVFVERDDDPAE